MKLETGQLLLAEPYLLDPNFKRSAIALVDHHREGTVGFVLSAPTDTRVSELIADFPEFGGTVSVGGPVQRDTLHFVHTLGGALDDALPICGDLYWGGDFAHLIQLIEVGAADETNVRFFLGYSGWSPGQLEEEVREGTWVFGDLTADLVFGSRPAEVWARAMRRLGNTFGVISEMDEEALN